MPVSFESDYIAGAHPEILRRLTETNLESLPGYGADPYCESAKQKILEACGLEHGEVEFLTGGTQANAVVISTMLADHEGVVAAATGHISSHEAGAIEYTGHEVLELPPEKTLRVTFNEITKNVVLESIQKPRSIDMGLVDAQQARRILDRIVGYKLSPLLWTKIRRGLSAGRVQSVAARLVVDREEEIRAFVPEEYWLLDAHLSAKGSKAAFAAHYYGTEKKKKELRSRAEVDAVIADVKDAPFTVKSVKRTDKPRSPAAPFITSTLQQEASRRLNMTPRRTMAVAQALYEGLPVAGQDSAGLITYMRTDSLRISAEAASAAKVFIQREYGQEYYPKQTRVFRTGKNAQDAHEAIRPADVELTPEKIRKDLTEEQYRLYRLIWRRFVASQMANAIYDKIGRASCRERV